MSGPIRLGMIGFGRIVELVHLPLLKQLSQFQVCGIFDITPQRLSLAAKRGFPVYPHLEQLLESSVDAVLIATPPGSHFELALASMRFGKHILLEKPVTVTAEEAIELHRTAMLEQRIVTVFHNRRYDQDFLLVKRMIEEGSLGVLKFVERRHHMFGSGAAFGVKSFRRQWRNEKSYGGGALLDWGVHLIDQLLQLKLGRISGVSATMEHLWGGDDTDVEDYVHALMKTDRNILLSMDVNFASAAGAPLWIVGGDQATLTVASNNEAYLYEAGKTVKPVRYEHPLREGPELIYSSFADAVTNQGKLAVTLEEAIETMKLLDRIRVVSQPSKEYPDENLIFSATI